MKWLQKVDQVLDRLSDRLNPLLVKEVRQMLKGKLFLTTFSLLLLGLWVSSMLGVQVAGGHIDEQGVPALLATYLIGLQITLLVFVPFMSFRSMQAETEENTWELIAITTLSARRIISGKVRCAQVMSFLLLMVVTPFVAFCSLLPGFDWLAVVGVLALTFIISLLNINLSVMLSSLATSRTWQVLTMLALLAILSLQAWCVCAMTFASTSSYYSSVRRSSAESWISVGLLLSFIVTYSYLFFEVAVSRVTFEADSRSPRIRLTCSLLHGFLLFLLISSDRYSSSGFALAFCLFVLQWAVFGLSACLEPETISTRIRRKLSWWSRLRSPFLPGGSRALVFMLLHLGSVPLVAMIAQSSLSGFRSGAFIASWAMYLLIYATLAVAACRALLAVKPGISRTYLRVGVVVCVVISMLPSMALEALAPAAVYAFFPALILNPFSYSGLGGGDWAIPMPLMLIALIGVHLNWEIIKRSVLDVSPVELEAVRGVEAAAHVQPVPLEP